jgi:hypothetical protein
MHNVYIEWWEHHHVFNGGKKASKADADRRDDTFVMMALIFFSAADELDGALCRRWHKGTHAFAWAYRLRLYPCPPIRRGQNLCVRSMEN